jgi:hypothetical protein
MEAKMRGILGVIVLVWLLIGVFAAWQRNYFTNDEANCATAANIALTIVAGPLNYFGVNPKADCQVNIPQPSSAGLPTLGEPDQYRMIGVAA